MWVLMVGIVARAKVPIRCRLNGCQSGKPGSDQYLHVYGTDAIERGPEMTALRDGVRGKDKLDVPIKMIWNYAGNCLINQHSEINRTHEILQDDKKCEMIVVIDCHMTSSAKYADILLPDCTASEQMDFALDASCGNMSYVIFTDHQTAFRVQNHL